MHKITKRKSEKFTKRAPLQYDQQTHTHTRTDRPVSTIQYNNS